VRKDRPPALRTAALEERPFALLEDRPGGLEAPGAFQGSLDSYSERFFAFRGGTLAGPSESCPQSDLGSSALKWGGFSSHKYLDSTKTQGVFLFRRRKTSVAAWHIWIKETLKPFFERFLSLPKDHKEEVMQTFMRALTWWNLPPGDYLEFGVYRGRSFVYAYKQAQRFNLKMHFYAFDSFQGLPQVKGHDKEYSQLRQGDYACDETSFKKILAENNVDLDAVTITPGFYDMTLNQKTKETLNIKRAAIVWIDCDIYESTRPVLDFITDYLTTGSIIAFDDWLLFCGDPNAGEMRAAREWLEKNRHIRLVEYKQFGLFGQSFIVHIEK